MNYSGQPAVPAASGCVPGVGFEPWKPSTWPVAPIDDGEFIELLRVIFHKTIFVEIENVIGDAKKQNGSLNHRGHVIAIALFCALDAISSYGYGAKNGQQIKVFVPKHFQSEYKSYGEDLFVAYRCAMVHSWNLFKVAITPGDAGVSKSSGILSIGLENFFNAIKVATDDYLSKLASDSGLMRLSRKRYKFLRDSARRGRVYP